VLRNVTDKSFLCALRASVVNYQEFGRIRYKPSPSRCNAHHHRRPDLCAMSLRKQTFPVTGMTCASCVASVERALQQAPGVAKGAWCTCTRRGHRGCNGYSPRRSCWSSVGSSSSTHGNRRSTAVPTWTRSSRSAPAWPTLQRIQHLYPGVLDRRGLEPHVYFEAAAVVITFILLGKFLEERAKAGTSSAIKKLMGLRPTPCCARMNGRPHRSAHRGSERG
jgi:cation transport ATPase